MRTWKQGIVGKLTLINGKEVYIKCLKYPLGVFYLDFDIDTNVLTNKLFNAFLDLSVLKSINKLVVLKITVFEKKVSAQFSIDTQSHLLSIDEDLTLIQNGLMKIKDIEKVLMTNGGKL